MKSKFGWILAVLLLPGQVSALGLGKLVVDSALNEPLEARIELLSPTREELDSLAVGLADSEAFERAGVERLFVLSAIKFELQESETGADTIRVYSRDPIREPFLNFLVEINWSRGRLMREYTVLLDPPLYDPGIRAPSVSIPAPAPAVSEPGISGETPRGSGEVLPAGPAVTYGGGDYGPTQENDTLWSIASRMRPDPGVSVQQMMLALYRTNPEAFINGNINGLRTGQILRMPSAEEIGALTREQAFAEAQSQQAAWDPGRAAEAAAPAQQAAPAAAPPDVAAPAPVAAPKTKDAELRLVAPGAGDAGAGQGAAAGGDRNIELANEQLSALTQENLDLKNRLSEAETIIDDLKRLIALKDEELAALQQKMAGPAAGDGKTEEPAVAPPAQEPASEAPAQEAPPPAAEAPAAQPAPAAKEPEGAAPAPEKPAPQKKAAPKPAAQPPEAPASGGIVDTVLALLMGNIVIIGGVLGVLLLVVGGLVFMARRKQAQAVEAEDEAAAAAVQFPDFAGSEEETILPGGGEPVPASEPEERGAAPAPAAGARAPAEAVPAPAPAAPQEEPQEDPLAEVNVFLAYEHFDQAEEFVREAIKREPDNLDFHSKLLEVFYAANDRRKYEEAARVLHDKVGGAGSHWDMAVAMWQEMSPSRPLFAEPSGDEEAPAAPATGVGRIDLTAQEKGAAPDDAGLDFDLGEMTAGGSAAPADAGEDVLDVTAAVGLDSLEEALPEPGASGSEDVLDLTGGQAETPADAGGEDLLDVTAHADLESTGLDADPLDVTVSAPKGTGTEEEPAAPAADAGNALDFDLNLDASVEPPAAPEEEAPKADDNLLEFESGLGAVEESGGMDLDLTAGLESATPEQESPAEDDNALELDIGGGDDLGLSLEVPGSEDAGGAEGAELSLDVPGSDSGELELSLEVPGAEEGSLELSLDTDDAGAQEAGELELSLDGDDGGDQTLFVPRTDAAGEQSAEDEIATKLDLAKAYVELGDKDSAKGILDEIGDAGSPEQRRQIEELLAQVS